MAEKRKIILSIETAIGGGSLAILYNDRLLDHLKGESSRISKAEYLLEQISNLLIRNGIEKKEIGLIGVSKDTGSLTGEKIGLAISKGLSRAIGCKVVEVPILDVLLTKVPDDFQGKFITGIVTGKDRILWQGREQRDSLFYNLSDKPSSGNQTEINALAESDEYNLLIIAANENIKFLPGKFSVMIEPAADLAILIGTATNKMRPIIKYN